MSHNNNVFPYYDDFNPSKKFYQVLFKPGYSVQARELTQLQTILQNQIKEFGNTVFKQGTVITGCAESHNFKTPFVKIEDIDTSVYSLESYEGATVTAPNGVSAIIKKTITGSEAETPNLNTLYLHYTSNNTTDENPELIGTISTFTAGQLLAVTGENSGIGEFRVASVNPVGFGSLFSMNDGIVYVNGRFLVHTNETIVIDRYSDSPTQKVGFRVVEEIASSLDDATLNDPAQGAYNFNAPGADRSLITTELYSYDGVGAKPDDFFLLFEVEEGQIKRRYNKTEYSQLSREFAHRTYDESGDYTVNPFPIVVNEHLLVDGNHGKYTASTTPVGDAGKLVVGVEPGVAYVRGYRHELFSTEHIEVEKSVATSTSQNRGTNTFYGNYILVTNLSGAWRLNGNTLVELRSTAWTYPAYPSAAGVTGGGSVIGTARIRNLEYEGGTAIGTTGAIYRMYLHEITFTTGTNGISTIAGFRLNEGYISYANVYGTPALLESKMIAPIFPFPEKYLRNLGDSSYVYKKTFSDMAVSAGGSFSLSLSANEEWAMGTTLTDALLEENLRVTVIQAGVDFEVSNKLFNVTTSMVTAIDAQSMTIDLGVYTITGSATVDVVVNVRTGVAVAQQKTLRSNHYVRLEAAEGPFTLGFHDVIEIQRIWAASTSAAWPTTDPLPDDANWDDVTEQFDLDNGQRDTLYGLATITKNSLAGTFTGKRLLVKFDYLEHSSSGGFYSVDSYPLPSQGAAPSSTEIDWFAIPSYTSRQDITYNLRDCLDFRPTVENTGLNSTVPDTATLNPASTEVFASGAVSPDPFGTFLADITYNLPRIDRVILDENGIFSTVTGIPSEIPVVPRQPNNAMSLAIINIPSYPALSPFYARQVGRIQHSTTSTFVDNSRFTMKDIGSIQRRVERLERYASLSVLEQQAANMFIADISGNNRYKNGIVVDALDGHNVGSVTNEDYACSIAKGELRPFFNLDNVAMEYDETSVNVVRKSNDKAVVVRQTLVGSEVFVAGESISTDGGGAATIRYTSIIAVNDVYRWIRMYLEEATGIIAEGSVITGGNSGAVGTVPLVAPVVGTTIFPAMVTIPTDGNLVTLPYTHEVYVENPYATKSRNCASPIIFTFEGTMELSPRSDEWPDVSVRPEVQFNTDGISDNWVSMASSWGTQWENWKTLWQKYDAAEEKSKSRAIDPSALTTTQRQLRDGIALGVESNKHTNVIPYMRSLVVTFTASRLKANTPVYPFFDGVDVSAFCKMGIVSTDPYGTSLITDANGNLVGQFRIPAETFMSGSKNFVVSDVSSDPYSESATTMAQASFTSSGDRSFEKDTILSTQKPELTFLSTIDDVANRLSTTSDTKEINDPITQSFFVSNSDGGSLLTKVGVYFRTKSQVYPITLQIREMKNGYPSNSILPYSTVTLDPADVNTSEDASAVSEFVFPSPVYLKNNTEYTFVLLPAGNDTGYNVWVGELGEKEVGTTNIVDKQANAGILYVSGNNRTWTQLINEDIKFTLFRANFTSTGTLYLRNLPIEYMTFSNMTGTFYPGDEIEGTEVGAGQGIIQFFNYETNEAQVLVTGGYFGDANGVDSVSCGDVEADTLSIKKAVDAISPNLSFLNFNNTSLTFGYRIYGYESTPYGSEYIDVAPVGTVEFLTPMGIFSDSDYDSTFMMKLSLATSAPNISPVIDLEKAGCIIIANAINNPASVLTAEADDGGTALSRYISRTATLDDGQEADDLMVFLSSLVPSNSTVYVFAKLSSPEDTSPFSDRPWTLLTENTIQGTSEYQEKYYTIPSEEGVAGTGYLNSGVYQYTVGNTLYKNIKNFAIKILFTSNDTTRVPKIRNLRTIALQA